jgi:YD repeat-containing protein
MRREILKSSERIWLKSWSPSLAFFENRSHRSRHVVHLLRNLPRAGTPRCGQSSDARSWRYGMIFLRSYLQQSTTGTPTVSGYVPATDTVYYDAFGRTLAVAQASQGSGGSAQDTTRAYAYDSAGQILEERSGTVSGTTLTPTNGYFAHHYTYVNGQQVSDMDEAGEIGVESSL